MPYRIEKRKGGRKPWMIIREDTGAVVGFSETRAKAQASVRARKGAESRTVSRRPTKRWSWW
jgi:hypothetical protein